MIINFFKMQSLGNDFVFIDSFQIANQGAFNADLVKKISNRNYGIGCDCIVLYKIDPCQNVDIDVKFFNSDGSEAEICGNAMRCAGILVKKIKNLSKCVVRAKTQTVCVNAGNDNLVSFVWEKFSHTNSDIGLLDGKDPKNLDMENDMAMDRSTINDLGIYHASAIYVGNPHLILFLKKVPSLEQIISVGTQLESNHLFKNKVNVGFSYIKSQTEMELFVFERGAGLTLACGSGACAAALVARANNFIDSNSCLIFQRGGTLHTNFTDDGKVQQSASATLVFDGNIDIPDANISSECSEKEESDGIVIYTDGACSNNPGSGGWAAIIIKGNEKKEIFGSEQNTTNNRMELMAVIKSLQQLGSSNNSISVYTDSMYVKNGITSWITTWIKNDWKNSEKKLVKNKDLWEQLLALSTNLKISWCFVKGHSGDKNNEHVDYLAKKQCAKG